MKNAIEELTLKRRDEAENSIPPGCIALQDMLRIVDKGRDGAAGAQNFHLMRVLGTFHKQCELEGKYLRAKEFSDHYKCLVKEEESRLLEIIKKKQSDDRRKLLNAHEHQMIEFCRNWEKFMSAFEQKSHQYITELNQTHEAQLSSLQKEIIEDVELKPQRWSKELVDWRKREAIMADQQRYHEAQKIKVVSDALEAKERSNMNSNLQGTLKLKERNLRNQQAAEKAALLKRIDTKRREFEHQRETDHSRCLQRNKNIIAMLDSKCVSGNAQ
jgi:glycerol-3-phosphate cytidylyltransferase-like family protein